MPDRSSKQSGSKIENEIVRQTREAFHVKDDWPQALVMSMGVLFLLAGLGLDIAHFTGEGPKDKPAASGGFVRTIAIDHPGAWLLALGTAFTLIGYFLPRKRA